MNKAAKMVAGAMLGLDFRTIIVNGKAYSVSPPTCERLAAASYYLPEVEDCENIADVIAQMRNVESACNALSWLIGGDENLSGELMKGTLDEILDGLSVAYSLLDVRNFKKLSILARNVARLTANPK